KIGKPPIPLKYREGGFCYVMDCGGAKIAILWLKSKLFVEIVCYYIFKVSVQRSNIFIGYLGGIVGGIIEG
ncbi:hypothetical protein M6D81_31785, partial [Paenibacillus sp. J5C_2022]|uniref:hypothetical protein n=1 Tax=Paenibacillus sp. J5C2022 TaxID=2977129 RepID=UPI0021D13689